MPSPNTSQLVSSDLDQDQDQDIDMEVIEESNETQPEANVIKEEQIGIKEVSSEASPPSQTSSSWGFGSFLNRILGRAPAASPTEEPAQEPTQTPSLRSQLRVFLDSIRGVAAAATPLTVALLGQKAIELLDNDHSLSEEQREEFKQIITTASSIANIVAVVGPALAFGMNFVKSIRVTSTPAERELLGATGMLEIGAGIFSLINFGSPAHILSAGATASASALGLATSDLIVRQILNREGVAAGSIKGQLGVEAFKDAVSIGNVIGISYFSDSMVKALSAHPNTQLFHASMLQGSALNYILLLSFALQCAKEALLVFIQNEPARTRPQEEIEEGKKARACLQFAMPMMLLSGASFGIFLVADPKVLPYAEKSIAL